MPTTVTGSIKNLATGAVTSTSNAFVRLWLRGTRGNTPRITGTGAIAPQVQGSLWYVDLPADVSGNVSGTVYSTRDASGNGNGEIEVGGSLTAVWYGMVVYSDGVAGPEVPIHAKSGATIDVANVTPISTPPVTVSPTGDSTYLRIDGGNSPVTGITTFSGGISSKKLNNIRFADLFSGNDLGAKINAADTDLGAGAGEIWVNNNAGLTASTAISISANHALRFIEGGTYSFSAGITLATKASIIGIPSGLGADLTDHPVVLKMANSANLDPFITSTAGYVSLRDLTIDGNKANNASAGVAVLFSTNGRNHIENVTIRNAKTHGLSLSTSGQARIVGLISIGNGGDGLLMTTSADVFISNSEFENNGQYGIEANNSPTCRINLTDVGGNTLDGIYAYGTVSPALGSGGWVINGTQFGNQKQRDIYVKGYDTVGAGNVAASWAIAGNAFNGSSQLTANNTWGMIVLEDAGQHTVTGNTFKSSASTNQNKYAVELRETGAGRAVRSSVVGNTVNTLIGTSFASDTNSNKSYFGMNQQSTTASQIGPGLYLLNNDPLQWLDTGGTLRSVLNLGSDNTVYLTGRTGTALINFQPTPGTSVFALNSGGAVFGGGTAVKQVQLFTGVAVDPGSIGATSRGSIAVTIAGTPGIAAGDVIIPVSGINGINDDLIFEGVVATGANQVTWYFYNPTAAPIDDASNNWSILWIDVT